MRLQSAGVTHPLASVGKLTGAGHRVVFDDDEPGGGYALHKATGKVMTFTKESFNHCSVLARD